jgi:hypothetical protein
MISAKPKALRGALFFLGVCATALQGASAQANQEPLETSVCALIEQSAAKHDLPIVFFTRLIWRESSFRPGAISPAGAQGIAQFMPGTAAERGLANPFDPEEAIPKSAELLRDLKAQFGNLGLAAAAYNAGPRRVRNWLDGNGGLPAETHAYVEFITRHAPEDWSQADANAKLADSVVFPHQSCHAIVADARKFRSGEFAESRIFAPWGVQLAGGFSKANALRTYQRARSTHASVIGALDPMIIGRRLRSRGRAIFYQVRTPALSRGEAEAICAKIHAAGGPCIVLKS